MESKVKQYGINFCETILHRHHEVEAIVRCNLTHQSHPYLLDHNYKGALIMPTVFGLEAMAQVTALVTPYAALNWSTLGESINKPGIIIENIKLTRPIAVGQKGSEIEIYAEVLESATLHAAKRVRCGIRTASTGYAVDHFSAEFVLETPPRLQSSPLPMQKNPDSTAECVDLGVKPEEQLYGSILFQGPLFRRIEGLFYLESDNETKGKTLFRSRINATDQAGYLLGDPFFRDSLLQSAQLIIPQNQCLPIEIKRLELHDGYNSEPVEFCYTDVRKVDDKSYLATIEVIGKSGQVLQKLQDYRLQFLEKRPELPKAMELIPQKQKVVSNTDISTKLQTQNSDLTLLEPYKATAELLRIDPMHGGPQGQSIFVHRFIPDFKTFANLGNGIYFSHIFHWMGWSREMSSIPVLANLRALTESGRWGQVTNWANIEILGECRNENRIVEARMWCGKIGGTHNSSATLSFDWISRNEKGIEERIAKGQMAFTWVEIQGHGVVKAAPLPESYREFLMSMSAKNDAPNIYVEAPEPYQAINAGESLYKVTGGPRAVIPLASKVFETTLYDANLVGNLYFGNYSIWMGRLRDSYFYKLAPSLFTKSHATHELICKSSRIQHLREAMPYDEIYVNMGLMQLYEAGLDLQFEYFKRNGDGTLEKLAVADHHCVWTACAVTTAGQATTAKLPSEIVDELTNTIKVRTQKRTA